MKKIFLFLLSLSFVALLGVGRVYAAEDLWQIGVFDEDVNPIDGSSEYPTEDDWVSVFDYEIDVTTDFPGYIADHNLSYFVTGRPYTNAAEKINIHFTTDCYLYDSVLRFDRYGSEEDTILLDGYYVDSISASEGGYQSFDIDLGEIVPGDHTISIIYMGGASDNGHYVDALKLSYGSSLCDDDHDGVEGQADFCWGTESDEPTVTLGVNRHVWYEEEDFLTLTKREGKITSDFSLDTTHGCSCKQILDSMSETLDSRFLGHYKFGCSKSILEDWISGVYYIGPTPIETIEVPANDSDGVISLETLEIGKDYFLKAYGTATACWSGSCHIRFDAEYTNSYQFDLLNPLSWVDGVASPYKTYGLNLLDLKVDGSFIDWGDFNFDHTYNIPYPGTGDKLDLGVYDLAGSYFNDEGSLFVDLIEDKWVDLW